MVRQWTIAACFPFLWVIAGSSSGLEWKEIQTDFNAVSFGFSTDDIGWATGGAGGRFVFTTADRGENWTQLPYILPEVNDNACTPVFFYGAASRWVVVKDTLHHSTDRGSTWNSTILTTPDFWSVYFMNDSDGVANDDSLMYWTDDCGRNWQRAELDSDDKPAIYSIKFLDSKNGWIAGWSFLHWDGGTIFRTGDGGRTWKTVDITYILNDIHCLDSLHAYAAGLDPISRCGILIMTADGWKTKKEVRFKPFLDKVVFMNSQTGLVKGDTSVWETNDSGNTWTEVETVGKALNIGRSDNMLIISSPGKIFTCEFTTGGITDRYRRCNIGRKAGTINSTRIIMNKNCNLSHVPQPGFDLLGKPAHRMTRCSGCYIWRQGK